MRRPKSSFEQFEATSLYCPKCKTAVPVRKKLLLVLPEGEEYEYLCVYCSSSVGTKIDKDAPQIELIMKPEHFEPSFLLGMGHDCKNLF